MQGLPGAWNLVATPLHATPPHEVGTGRVPPADEATAGGTLLFFMGKSIPSRARLVPMPVGRRPSPLFSLSPPLPPRRSFRARLDTAPTRGPSFCLKVTLALHATPSPQSRQRRHASTSRPASPCPVQRKRAKAPAFFPFPLPPSPHIKKPRRNRRGFLEDEACGERRRLFPHRVDGPYYRPSSS